MHRLSTPLLRSIVIDPGGGFLIDAVAAAAAVGANITALCLKLSLHHATFLLPAVYMYESTRCLVMSRAVWLMTVIVTGGRHCVHWRLLLAACTPLQASPPFVPSPLSPSWRTWLVCTSYMCMYIKKYVYIDNKFYRILRFTCMSAKKDWWNTIYINETSWKQTSMYRVQQTVDHAVIFTWTVHTVYMYIMSLRELFWKTIHVSVISCHSFIYLVFKSDI